MHSLPVRLFAALVLSCLAFGCAETQPPIQRIGNDILEKAAFDGEWYYSQTVIDTPFGIPYAFVGDQSIGERIVWDIQEEYLIVRRSYAFVTGSEDGAITGPGAEHGVPIAMYPISSHFDIRRIYNSVTGEEENVIIENDSDRPWNTRRYMRVDWSQNLITEGEFLIYARIFDGIEVEPMQYHINDPSHPDAPAYGFSDDGQFNYLDVVSRMLISPTMVEIDGYEWPTCWLEYSTHVDCAPAEISVRHSYLRIDPQNDYQPMDYTGDRMERFGYFVTERAGYDPEYGLVEPARRRWVNRHDLWQQSYWRDADLEFIRCSSDAQCDDGEGSVCDLNFGMARNEPEGACTISYRERRPRTVPYHMSLGFPQDLRQTATTMVEEWNETFVETVDSLREQECLSHGGAAATCAAERGREDAAHMFVLCSSPVEEGDHEACGEVDSIARIGDLRYSLLAWVPDPHLGSPLGYGPSTADPLTGELVNANAFMYGAGVEELASFGRDLVAVLNGDVPESDIMSGANVERWVARQQSGARAIPMTAADIDRTEEAIDVSRMTGGRRGAAPRPSRDLGAMRSAAVRSLSRRGAFGVPGSSRARIEQLRGTPIEAALTHPDLSAAAGVDPNLPTSEAFYDEASPLRGLSLRALRARREAHRRMRAHQCVLRVNEFADEGLLGLARAIQQAATTGDGTMEWYGQSFDLQADGGAIDYVAVRDMLRHPILHSTGAHEIGHTLGLRHNFSGSFDALNYGPRYWALRDDGDMRARPFDPISEAEINGRLREAQYSTVMDYGNNFISTDAEGLGHYDFAAIKMGYGDLVEVFTEATDPLELSWIYFQQLFGWPGPLTYNSFFVDNPVEAHHYTDIPGFAGGISGLEARADVPYTSLVAEATLASDDGIDMPLVDAAGRPAVPYRFCSDEYSDISADCMLYDAGGDEYEATQSIIDSYWNYYAFDSFRRERLGFEDYGHYDRVYWRYFTKLQSINQVYAFNRTFMSELFDEDLEGFWNAESGLATSTLAVGAAYELLRRVVTAPEPGGYVTYIQADGSEALLLDEFSAPEVEIDTLDGRYLETTWDFDGGYFWYDQLSRVGFFVDKVLALIVLVDPETGILGQDTEADVRGFQINFASTFGDSMTSFLRGVMTEDYAAIGPRMGPDGLEYPDALEISDGSMPGTPIDPAAGFSVQLTATSFAMAWIPLTYDDVFFESARVMVQGSAESLTIPVAERVTFRDPFTSLNYIAASYPGGGGVETGLGARMLLHAAELEAAGAFFELDQYMDIVRYQRSLTWYYGFGP